MDKEARSELLSMMGLVAAVVAVVILVFFGIGYAVRQAVPVSRRARDERAQALRKGLTAAPPK